MATHRGAWRVDHFYDRADRVLALPSVVLRGAGSLVSLLLVVTMGLGAHASKQSLGPMEPALRSMGVGPVVFGALTVVPGLASVLMPSVWGAAWRRHAPAVLLLSPVAQLAAQLLLAGGIAAHNADSGLAAPLIGGGLVLFSLGRAGIAVAQHATLAFEFSLNLAPAFAVTIGCTQLVGGAMNFSVPRLVGSAPTAQVGLLWLQGALLLPHAVSSVAGALLAHRLGAMEERREARWQRKEAEEEAEGLAEEAGEEAPLPLLGGSKKPRAARTSFESVGSEDGEQPPLWRHAIPLLGAWRALVVGTFHGVHPLFVALLSSGARPPSLSSTTPCPARPLPYLLLVPVGVTTVDAGTLLANNNLVCLLAFVLVGLLGRAARCAPIPTLAPPEPRPSPARAPP